MPRFRRKLPIRARSDGRFDVELPPEVRQTIADLAAGLEELVTQDVPETKRLFPTAYPDDPEKDAGYQIFARDQLIEQRSETAEILRRTAHNDILTADELGAWMGAVNDARLVLGTRLDVSEDDQDINFDDPDAEAHILYHQLGVLLHHMVEAMSTTLPD